MIVPANMAMNSIQYLTMLNLRLTCLMIIFYCTCVKGDHRVVCSSQPVLAKVGDTVVLPCHIDPPISATRLTTEWKRTEKNYDPQFVYVRQQGHVGPDSDLNELYRGQRSTLFEEKLPAGDVSLGLYWLQFSDEGTYQCYVPNLGTDRRCLIHLRVGNVSQPVISPAGPKDDGLSLTCDSGCWYPRPEVSWLDSNGTFVPAEASVTDMSSQHCYAVQSNVTVRESGRVTCRVHLAHINHTAEIHYDYDSPACCQNAVIPAGLSRGHITGIVLGFLGVCALIFVAVVAWICCIWKKSPQKDAAPVNIKVIYEPGRPRDAVLQRR